jgi:hypothetical protein
MKTLFFLGACTFSFGGFAQGVVQFPVFNVLYLGYANRLEIAVPKDEGKYTVFAEGAILQKHETFYTVLVKDIKRATIGVLNEKGDTIAKQEFLCRHLPDCQLYWGSAKNGEALLDYTESLRAGYPDFVHLTKDFIVVSYEVNFNGGTQSFQVQGNDISSLVIEYLKNQTTKTEVLVTARVVGTDGFQRINSASFVFDPL